MENSKALFQHYLPRPVGLCSINSPFTVEANHNVALALVNGMNGPAMLQVPVSSNPQYQYPSDFGLHYYTFERDPPISEYVPKSCLSPCDSSNTFNNFANLEAHDTRTSSGICPSVPIPQMSRTSFNVGYYVPPSVEPGDPYGGLEIVWNQHFSYLFSAFPEDVWSFGPRNPSEGKVSNWAVFRDMAKVRFCCKKCKHGWTSMHGPVVFYYMYDEYVRKGSVRFILTGQKCIECKSQDFETPMWYPEEAQKVMTNLYFEIASKVYKKATPPLITNRRHGRPRQQHVASDCQGCHLGICKPKLEINNNSDNNNNKTV